MKKKKTIPQVINTHVRSTQLKVFVILVEDRLVQVQLQRKSADPNF